MKTRNYPIGSLTSDKILDELKADLEPEDTACLTLKKYSVTFDTIYEINYSTYVSKEEYKRIKEIAKNESCSINETNSHDFSGLPENVKDAIEHQCAIWLAIANHEDCEK